MPAARIPRVKVCCIKNRAEAELALRFGADALGLVGSMPSGPGVISDEEIRIIAGAVPPPVATFLLTSETNADKIIEHQRRVHTNTIQIVDELKEGTHERIKSALRIVKIVQVIHVVDRTSVEAALNVDDSVDALLLDSGNPNLPRKELGGTGRIHDWSLSREIRERSPKPVFLAGGLSPENVRDAMDAVQPFGLDLCSGVRTDGRLDAKKLSAFFEAIRG